MECGLGVKIGNGKKRKLNSNKQKKRKQIQISNTNDVSLFVSNKGFFPDTELNEMDKILFLFFFGLELHSIFW